jgi:hypothetical protein
MERVTMPGDTPLPPADHNFTQAIDTSGYWTSLANVLAGSSNSASVNTPDWLILEDQNLTNLSRWGASGRN